MATRCALNVTAGLNTFHKKKKKSLVMHTTKPKRIKS